MAITATYSVFDRVTVETDTCMTTAEHCIAAIGLNDYRHERSCHDFIISPARLYASQLGGSCCVETSLYCIDVKNVFMFFIYVTFFYVF